METTGRTRKRVRFCGNSLEADAVLGAGVREIRIRDQAGAFRVIYLATVKDAVCVLHCFQKKMQKTSRADIDLAERRFRELMNEAKP